MIYTIYKISIAGEDYIGSTRDFKQRKKSHKSICNNNNDTRYSLKLYNTIRENGGWDCCNITPVEEFDCETKRQAECREEYWRAQGAPRWQRRDTAAVCRPNRYASCWAPWSVQLGVELNT